MTVEGRLVVGPGPEIGGLSAEGYKGTFWADENALCFAYRGDHVDEYICENVSNHTFKIDAFIHVHSFQR